MSAARTVEFFFSPGSRCSYRAATRMAGLDARRWAAHYGVAFREPPSHEFYFALLARAAVAAQRLRAADLHDPETARLLAATAREAVERGAFGVPTFFVGDEMFWGNDRIVLLERALEGDLRG